MRKLIFHGVRQGDQLPQADQIDERAMLVLKAAWGARALRKGLPNPDSVGFGMTVGRSPVRSGPPCRIVQHKL